jgi:hypothetical protein
MRQGSSSLSGILSPDSQQALFSASKSLVNRPTQFDQNRWSRLGGIQNWSEKMQKMKWYFLGLTAIFFLLASGSSMVSAQGIVTGSISGNVTDQTGAVIPNALITAVSDSTGTTLQAKSNGVGFFLLSNAPVGSYTITIAASGFGTETVTKIEVSAGGTTPVGQRKLTLGTANQTVQVEGGASQLMNTETAQGETVIDAEQLASLPLDGGFDSTALLVPGVVATHADNMSNTNGVGFSANGQRGRSNNFEIDGQSNNDNSVAGPQLFFSNQDAIQEISIISNNFGAQYGRNMGAVVNYITKNGTNQFHGTAFELYTGDWLSSLEQGQKDPQFGFCPGGSTLAYSQANGCTLSTVPRFVQNNFGGTIGGPILKDKLFFFGSTFLSRTFGGPFSATSGGAAFPDPTGLKQLQAAFPNNPGVDALVDDGPYAFPAGNPSPITANTSTTDVTDGNTVATIEVAPYSRRLPNSSTDQEDMGRLDYQASSKDRFYLRYLYQDNPTIPAGGNIASGGYYDVTDKAHSVGADWTHTFSPNFVDQLRYSFQQTTLAFDSGGDPSCTIANFTSCPSAVTIGTFAGFGYNSAIPQGRVVKVSQVQDNGTWNHGRQTILMGGEFDYQNSPNVFLPNAAGTFNFSPGETGTPFRLPAGTSATEATNLNNGLTGLLEGISATELTAGKTTDHFTEPDFALYFQDDWKIMHNLTLNLGLRYEFFSQGINSIHSETVAQQTGPNPFWNTSLPLSATTFPKIASSFRNVEPRIGFAYTPGVLKKMVVHGGFALNVDPSFSNIFVNVASNAPAVNAGAFNCDGQTVQCVPSGGLSFGTVQSADLQFIPTGVDPRQDFYIVVPTNFKNPMAESYTFGFQYQVASTGVVEIRYVGNHTFDQFQSLNGNPELAAVQSSFPSYGNGQTACPDPTAFGYGRALCSNFLIENTGNTAFSLYNGLQTSFTLRNLHNFTGILSYTWSRTIDNTSEIFGTGGGGNTSAYAQDPLNTNVGERGVSGNSYPNVVALQLTYNEPWFKQQHGILGRLLGGYSFNAFYDYNAGQPFNPIQNALAVESPNVLADISGAPGNPGGISAGTAANINPTMAETSFCDFVWGEYFGNSCRPILSNPKAPLTSVGINTGPGGYVDYVSGAPTTASAEHWLWNNQYEAINRNNPFPGVGRNILRGDSYNDFDLSVVKGFKVAERIKVNLQASAFNVLNRGYYGTPDANIEDTLYPVFYGVPNSFLSNYYASGGGESPAAGGAFSQGPGNRNIQVGAKVVF